MAIAIHRGYCARMEGGCCGRRHLLTSSCRDGGVVVAVPIIALGGGHCHCCPVEAGGHRRRCYRVGVRPLLPLSFVVFIAQ